MVSLRLDNLTASLASKQVSDNSHNLSRESLEKLHPRRHFMCPTMDSKEISTPRQGFILKSPIRLAISRGTRLTCSLLYAKT